MSDALPVTPYAPSHPKSISKGGAERRIAAKTNIGQSSRRVVTVPDHILTETAGITQASSALRVDPERVAEDHIQKLMQRARDAAATNRLPQQGDRDGDIAISASSLSLIPSRTVSVVAQGSGVGILLPRNVEFPNGSSGVRSHQSPRVVLGPSSSNSGIVHDTSVPSLQTASSDEVGTVAVVNVSLATSTPSASGDWNAAGGGHRHHHRDSLDGDAASIASAAHSPRRIMSELSDGPPVPLLLPKASIVESVASHANTSFLPSIVNSGGRGNSTTTLDGNASATQSADKDPILSQRVTGYSKDQHIKYLEAYTARHCASTRTLEARCDGYCRVLDAVCDMHPGLVNLYSTVKHFMKELVHVIHAERRQYAEKLVKMKQDIHSKQQAFYEDKFVKAMSEKAQWQRMCQALTKEVAALKRSRDDDLMESKKAVLGAVMKVKEDEEELNSVRALVATVFQVAKEHEARAMQLTEVLEANRIAVPPRNIVEAHQQSQRERAAVKRNDLHSTTRQDEAAEIDDDGTADGSPLTGKKTNAPDAPDALGLSGSNQNHKYAKQSSAPSSPRHQTQPSVERKAATKRSVGGAAAVDRLLRGEVPEEPEGDLDGDDAVLRQFQQPSLRQQVTIDFIEASRRELEQCRLSTQRVLVSCASESQSSFKLLIGSLKAENDKLKAEVHQLEASKLAMERFMHEKRFLKKEREDIIRDEASMENVPAALLALQGIAAGSSGDDAVGGGVGDTTEARKRALWNRDGSIAKKVAVPSLPLVSVSQAMSRGAPAADIPREQLTPRPVFPFDIQPVLGLDLRQSSGRIASELSTVALNLKQANEELHVRVRRLASAVSWMDEFTINKLVLSNSDEAFLRVAPSAEWDHCHHFLRTTLQPHVPNLNWTPQLTSCLINKFFESFDVVREASRYERDLKMLAPRVYQPYERRYHNLIRLDATQEELLSSRNNVPIGYVVTQFVIQELLVHSMRNAISAELIQSRRVSPTVRHRVLELPVEMELAKVCYNLWYSARKYRAVEPMCEMFVSVLEGRLPVEIYAATQSAHQFLVKKLNNMEGVRSGGATYTQLTGAVSSMLQDQAADIVRGGVLAVSQTMEFKGIPVIGKIALAEVIADETRTIAGGGSGAGNGGSPKRSQQVPQVLNSNAGSGVSSTLPILLANGALSALPNAPLSSPANAFAGASLLTRYLRRLVIQKMEAVCRHLEAMCYPHVRESAAVRGMFLLKISGCKTAIAAFDSNPTPYLPLPPAGGAVPPAGAARSGTVPPSMLTSHNVTGQLGASMMSTSSGVPQSPSFSMSMMAAGSQQPTASPTSHYTTSLIDDSRPTSPPELPPRHIMTPGQPSSGGGGSAPYSQMPPHLHVSGVPISLGSIVTPHQLLLQPCNFSDNFLHVVTRMGLQRYSSSIHFPAPKEEPSPLTTTASNGGGSSSGGGGSNAGADASGGASPPKKGGRRRSMKKSTGAIQPLSLDDSDWVEWYAFCVALRTTPLLLKDAFLDGWKGTAVPNDSNAAGSTADTAAPMMDRGFL